MKKACHVLYTDLVLSCPWLPLSELWNTSLCPHKAVLCWQSSFQLLPVNCSKVTVFPIIFISIRTAYTLRAERHEGWGKEGKILQFFFLCCFNCNCWTEKSEITLLFFSVKSTGKLVSTGLERTSRAHTSSETGLNIPNMSTMAAHQTCSYWTSLRKILEAAEIVCSVPS